MTPSPAFEVDVSAVGDAKRSYVRGMFTAIAPRYDLLNHLLSFTVDRYWRRAAVRRLGWERKPDGVYLDLCSGTLDLAAALARAPGFRGTVIGADFVVPMLARGRGKAGRTRPVGADALALPFPDGRFVVLEFSTPRFAPLRALYLFYFRRVLPAIGRAVSKHRDAYSYLPESVLEFPGPEALARRLAAAGFSGVRYELLSGGICAVHHGAR